MCQFCNRVPSRSLQATIMAVLVKAGLDTDVALNASNDVLVEVAKNEVSHPNWAAKVLGAEQEDDAPAQEETDGSSIELPSGVTVHVHRYSGSNEPEEVGVEEMPKELADVLQKIGSILGRRKAA